MRSAVLALGISLGMVGVSLAMPVVPFAVPRDSIKVHGCHHYYAHDLSGWHRHDKECRTLRGVVGRKSRNPTKG